MEKIELYNQISHEIVKNYNTYLHKEDVKILNSLDVAPHYTISHILEDDISAKLYETARKLNELDNSLIINDPKNYHITLFWKGIDSNLETKTAEIEKVVNSHKFDFEVEELLYAPLGISAKFYPKTEDLVNARTEIYNLTGTPVTVDERFVTTWVSLAFYSQIPNESVKQFIQENAKINFGNYTPKSFTLYISTNKILKDPKVIKEFVCKC